MSAAVATLRRGVPRIAIPAVLTLCLLAVLVFHAPALRAWLGAIVFVAGLPLGSLLLLLMMRLIPGAWREDLEPFAAAGAFILPVVAIGFLPVLLGQSALYPWFGATQETGFRTVYLSAWFFTLRTILFLVVMSAVTLIVLRTRSPLFPVLGLILLPVLESFIATDWLLSLDPAFHSSGFGLYVLSTMTLSALCVLAIAACVTGWPMKRPGIVGSLLLSAGLFWAYFAFMQYFITWSGDLPQGVRWYQMRGVGLWAVVEWAIALLRLAPMFLLLFAPIRTGRKGIVAVSMAMLAGGALEFAWIALPGGPDAGAITALFGVAAFAILGWLAAELFIWALGRRLRP